MSEEFELVAEKFTKESIALERKIFREAMEYEDRQDRERIALHEEWEAGEGARQREQEERVRQKEIDSKTPEYLEVEQALFQLKNQGPFEFIKKLKMMVDAKDKFVDVFLWKNPGESKFVVEYCQENKDMLKDYFRESH